MPNDTGLTAKASQPRKRGRIRHRGTPRAYPV